MDEITEAIAATKAVAEKSNRKFTSDFERDTFRWNLARAQMVFLRAITAGQLSGRALISNRHVHLAAENALATALQAEYERFPDRQYLFVTLACDIGLTWERAPDINFVALRNTFYQHLERCGLHGIGVIELEIWKTLPGEQGRRIVPHMHGVFWCECGEKIDADDLQAELCGRRALVNTSGARPAVVQVVNLTPADFARIGRYMIKRPAYAKLRLPNLNKPGFHLVGVNHERGSAARLIEIFSYVEVGDLVFSIGGGRNIANAIRRAAAFAVRERPGSRTAPSRERVKRYWREIRRRNGSKLFRECRIITRPDQR